MDGQNTNKIQEYEEIDLREVVDFFIKNKRFILTSAVLFGVLAFIVSSALPKVYKIDSALEIGLVGEGETMAAIEDPVQLKDKIDKDIYGQAAREKLSISEKDFPKLKAQNTDKTRILYISTESSETERAKKVLEEINSIIIDNHQNRVDAAIKDYSNSIDTGKKNIERIKNKIASLEEERKILEGKVEVLEKISVQNQDLSIQYALLNAKENLESKKQEIDNQYLQVNALQQDINKLQIKIDESRPTVATMAPSVSEKPVAPRSMLNALIFSILGFGAGTIFLFFRGWLRK
ncbi:MAG TPA: Wzz/FepE/Etk N-terminal domain-containing protein [Candidatus Paceibacterota bacterium]|nr:Wzz/FepE/Etk N-terminal domain-containing protein [Candidatus Pacearchaeota archaeon]HRZ50665.1 Wzz/FepE/Etk N-terminal domain-containing protein [Candidatus Paceibacterota bacterium]HSA36438.1 Wzz/FepE/Etk N-terminal domain-containing protein [Candidatus Paceibacterota bacterium]